MAVVDRTLPGANGLELMARLKRLHGDLQVIVLSGRSDAASVAAALDGGAFEYLTKPCTLAELDATIQRALKAREPA